MVELLLCSFLTILIKTYMEHVKFAYLPDILMQIQCVVSLPWHSHLRNVTI